jgi:hypothetical protein
MQDLRSRPFEFQEFLPWTVPIVDPVSTYPRQGNRESLLATTLPAWQVVACSDRSSVVSNHSLPFMPQCGQLVFANEAVGDSGRASALK